MSTLYRLRPDHTLTTTDAVQWARAMVNGENLIERTRVGALVVSTVCLGIESPSDPGCFFETMVFRQIGMRDNDHPLPRYTARYRTYDEAVAGHKRSVVTVRGRPQDYGGKS